jgi:hypothetical protein
MLDSSGERCTLRRRQRAAARHFHLRRSMIYFSRLALLATAQRQRWGTERPFEPATIANPIMTRKGNLGIAVIMAAGEISCFLKTT